MPTIKKQQVRKIKKRVVRKKQNVVDRIAPIYFDDDEGISINLYGKSGTGKTVLWSTFPKPILAIVCSALKKPGELRSINTAENRKTISTVTLENSNELKDLIEYQQNEKKFKTVVLDHATGLQDLLLKEILNLDELPAQGSWGMATRENWGQCSLQTKELLRALLNLFCNRVIIAQERVFDTEGDEDIILPFVASALTPSTAGWLGPACDYVCQTFIQQKTVTKNIKIAGKIIKKQVCTEGVDYCLRTAPNPTYATKFRIPKGETLPEFIVDPTYAKIKKLINQGE